MDEKPFRHLSYGSHDILMFYDYKDLTIDNSVIQEANNYAESFLIAWSMGVWAANIFIKKFSNLKSSIAINGTPFPIHDRFGIPKKVYDLTLNNMSNSVKSTFYKNMFNNDLKFSAFMDNQPQRDVTELKEELAKLRQMVENTQNENIQYFNKVIIGKEDKIISYKNQIRFWNQYPEILKIIIDEPHYVFSKFNSWNEVITYDTVLF